MEGNLDLLLDLKRDAERAARFALELARTARVQAEDVQARLVARVKDTQDALGRAKADRPKTPGRASQAAMRERYLVDLARKAARAAAAAEAARTGALAEAIAVEAEARAVCEKALLAVAAVARMKERAEARRDRLARRRAEEAAADLANAAFLRRPGF